MLEIKNQTYFETGLAPAMGKDGLEYAVFVIKGTFGIPADGAEAVLADAQVPVVFADEHYGEPYLYVSPYPFPQGAGLPELPVGHWHTEGFVSAILPASLLVEAPDQRARAHDFLDSALAQSRDLLGVNTSA